MQQESSAKYTFTCTSQWQPGLWWCMRYLECLINIHLKGQRINTDGTFRYSQSIKQSVCKARTAKFTIGAVWKVLQYGFNHIKAVKGSLSSSPAVLILDSPQVGLDVMDSGVSVQSIYGYNNNRDKNAARVILWFSQVQSESE